MAEKAKIFSSGGGQAVELPKSCQFPDDQREVLARRHGNRVILEAVPERPAVWPQEFLDLIGSIDEELDIPPRTSSLKDPFE